MDVSGPVWGRYRELTFTCTPYERTRSQEQDVRNGELDRWTDDNLGTFEQSHCTFGVSCHSSHPSG